MSEHHAVPLRRTWVLLLTPTTAAVLATAVAAGAARFTGEPAGRPRLIAAATGILTAATSFAVTGMLGGPTGALIAIPWLIWGMAADHRQLQLCEGARSRPRHAAIGFGCTLVFTAVTSLLAAVSARVVD